MARLDNGQTFPTLEVPRTGGGILRLPDEFAGHYGVVLIYRGSWCPYCNAQLAAFQRATDTLTALDVRAAALSVDDEPTTKALADKHHLAFPVGHSADAEQVAALTGAYLNDDRRHLQSTGFVRPGRLRTQRRLLQRGHRPPRTGGCRRAGALPALPRLTSWPGRAGHAGVLAQTPHHGRVRGGHQPREPPPVEAAGSPCSPSAPASPPIASDLSRQPQSGLAVRWLTRLAAAPTRRPWESDLDHRLPLVARRRLP